MSKNLIALVVAEPLAATQTMKENDMITIADINEHKYKYPDFDQKRFIEWLDEKKGRWRSFPNVTKANQSRRRQAQFAKYLDSMD